MPKPSRNQSKKSTKMGVKKAQKPQKTARRAAKATKATTKGQKTAKTAKAPRFWSLYPRAEGNPYRAGSSYGVCLDILAASKEGMSRQELVEQLAKVVKKPVKNAGFDAAVVLSRTEGGKPHSSSRGDYTVEKTNDHVRLRTK
jgi:hypothetical protein